MLSRYKLVAPLLVACRSCGGRGELNGIGELPVVAHGVECPTPEAAAQRAVDAVLAAVAAD